MRLLYTERQGRLEKSGKHYLIMIFMIFVISLCDCSSQTFFSQFMYSNNRIQYFAMKMKKVLFQIVPPKVLYTIGILRKSKRFLRC